jgi:hypothetical protein
MCYTGGGKPYTTEHSVACQKIQSVVYSLILIAKTYGTLQSISSSITDKLISFQDRQVGETGPLIKDIDPKVVGDSYIPETDEYRCDIEIKVKY